MKIVIVAPRFPPQGEIGGIEIGTQEISKRLVAKGHAVSIVCSGTEDAKEDYFGARVIRQKSPKCKILGSFIFWIKIFGAIRKIKPDIVHCQTIQMGLPCCLAKKICKIPYVVWCHGFDVYFPWKFKKIISDIVLSNAGAIVALTAHMKSEVEKICRKEIIVLPNGVDLQKFGRPKKEHLGQNILFVGGLRKVKGIEYLIQAFEIISPKFPQAKLLLSGDGPEKENLRKLAENSGAKEKIVFLGHLPENELVERMACADVFVLPSLSEGFPLVVPEAMASGLPIVATNVRGLPEIIEDGKNGFLAEPGNAEQLAEKISLILSDKDLAQRISQNNKEKSRQYSWDEIALQTEIIYNKL